MPALTWVCGTPSSSSTTIFMPPDDVQIVCRLVGKTIGETIDRLTKSANHASTKRVRAGEGRVRDIRKASGAVGTIPQSRNALDLAEKCALEVRGTRIE